MSERQGAQPPLTEKQAREKLAQSEANVARQTRVAQRAFSHNVMLARDRLEFAKSQRTMLLARLAEAEPLRGHPDADFVYFQTQLLLSIYASVQKLMEIDLDCHAYNLELTETPSLLDGEDFRVPAKFLTYLEARGRLDVALAYYYWTSLVDGIDVVLRAGLNERAAEVRSEEEETKRAAAAEELRASFKTDRETAMMVGSLAAGFKEALGLMEWACTALPALDTRNATTKRELLGDIRWAKLNGKVQTLLGDVSKRTHTYPALARLFPPPDVSSLSFATVEDSGDGSGRPAVEDLSEALATSQEMAPKTTLANALAAAKGAAAAAQIRPTIPAPETASQRAMRNAMAQAQAASSAGQESAQRATPARTSPLIRPLQRPTLPPPRAAGTPLQRPPLQRPALPQSATATGPLQGRTPGQVSAPMGFNRQPLPGQAGAAQAGSGQASPGQPGQGVARVAQPGAPGASRMGVPTKPPPQSNQGNPPGRTGTHEFPKKPGT
jgi:hypothetical protein